MALSIVGVSAGLPLSAAHLTQFYNLLTGIMTDQPVTLKNTLRVGGNQGVGSVPFRIDGVAAQTARQLEVYTLAADTHPVFSVDKTGLVAWGAGGGTAPDASIARTGVGVLTLTGTLIGAGITAAQAMGYAGFASGRR